MADNQNLKSYKITITTNVTAIAEVTVDAIDRTEAILIAKSSIQPEDFEVTSINRNNMSIEIAEAENV